MSKFVAQDLVRLNRHFDGYYIRGYDDGKIMAGDEVAAWYTTDDAGVTMRYNYFPLAQPVDIPQLEQDERFEWPIFKALQDGLSVHERTMSQRAKFQAELIAPYITHEQRSIFLRRVRRDEVVTDPATVKALVMVDTALRLIVRRIVDKLPTSDLHIVFGQPLPESGGPDTEQSWLDTIKDIFEQRVLAVV